MLASIRIAPWAIDFFWMSPDILFYPLIFFYAERLVLPGVLCHPRRLIVIRRDSGRHVPVRCRGIRCSGDSTGIPAVHVLARKRRSERDGIYL